MVSAEGRLKQGASLALPSTIRSSFKYKRALYTKFKTMMDSKGTPTIFGTFTCNLAKPIYQNIVQQFYGNTDDILRDPYLIALAFNRDWKDFMNFMRSTWGDKY